MTGAPASQVLLPWPHLARRFSEMLESATEPLEIQDTHNQWFELRTVPLRSEKSILSGWLVMLNNITRRKQIETDLETLVNNLQTVSEVSISLASTLDMKELLQQIVDLTQERFQVYHVQVYLFDETEHMLILTASSGAIGRKMVAQGRRIVVGGGSMIGWCIAERQSRLEEDITEEAAIQKNRFRRAGLM